MLALKLIDNLIQRQRGRRSASFQLLNKFFYHRLLRWIESRDPIGELLDILHK